MAASMFVCCVASVLRRLMTSLVVIAEETEMSGYSYGRLKNFKSGDFFKKKNNLVHVIEFVIRNVMRA